jgi:flagellar basal body-associated protein FliL
MNHGRWFVALGVVLVVLVATTLGLVWWKSESNCEATLVFARTMEQAVQQSTSQTPEAKARADKFFDTVYDRLHC